jgi:hypothetical protein
VNLKHSNGLLKEDLVTVLLRLLMTNIFHIIFDGGREMIVYDIAL